MLELLVDNDVLIKASRYGVVATIPHLDCPDGCAHESGILGAARYVVGGRLKKGIEKDGLSAVVLSHWEVALPLFVELEPTDDELALSAALEDAALERGLPLDSGESQLVAMAIVQSGIVLTGDKRAVAALESLLDVVPELRGLSGRVASMEQLVWRLADLGDVMKLREAICADRSVDKAIDICFRCTNPDIGQDFEPTALKSYIEDERRTSPTLMFEGERLSLVSP